MRDPTEIHELTRILKLFDVAGHPVVVQPLGGGNVNDTYLAICRTVFAEEQLVLQRINSNVFHQPEHIMRNLRRLTAHVHPKLEYQASVGDRIWQMPKIIQTRAGNDFIIDGAGNTWRVITKIASATAFDKVQDAKHAQECGLVLGYFHWMVSDLDPTTLFDPLPGFHITPRYLATYDDTLNGPDANVRLAESAEAQRLAAFVEARRAAGPLFQHA
ncbi:MAG: aminoglycoside phosphotransferase, partial [Kiritimatiellaeota bacterium]|nr:aminoglycoside phosphotransferase [Kiritimatiellota bacterium]